MSSNPNRQKFFTEKQVAEMVAVSVRTVSRWIKKGELVAHRFDGLVRIAEADFLKFLATHRDA
jgi:excisionase family DNA binding protein